MSERLLTLLSLLIVTLLSFFTYFYRYGQPTFFYWDENYHVASAQKYLNGVFFMEPHPPLGKLLIALGEKLINANEADDQFVNTDHAKYTPENFSFEGYRLFPSLLAWLSAPLFFLLLNALLRKVLFAFFFSLLYVFDNALIVHGRGAMLESIQLFFILLTLLGASSLYSRLSARSKLAYVPLLTGVAFGLAAVTKVTALIIGIAFLPLLGMLVGDTKRSLLAGAGIIVGFLLAHFIVWQMHFSMGRRIETALSNGGYYQASADLKEILAEQSMNNPLNFPTMFRDALAFVPHYQKGVPKLNLCNQSENGSSPYLWPLGARSINYRWERKDGFTKYLYLQANPASWAFGLIGLVGGISLVWCAFFFGFRRQVKNLFWISLLVVMWLAYMLTMLQLDRVMYLYHYFIPLVFTYLIGALVFEELRRLGCVLFSPMMKFLTLTTGSFCVMGCYYYFSPLTYALPLSSTQIADRAWLKMWDLRCEQCDLMNPIARPVCDPKVKSFPNVAIGEVKAKEGFQDWGEPRLNSTVEQRPIEIGGQRFDKGIGVHANSMLRFPLSAAYKELSGGCGLPDSTKEKTGSKPSVSCEVFGDSKLLWSSGIIRGGEALRPFSVSVEKVRDLELKISDAGDGIDNDHGVWVDLILK